MATASPPSFDRDMKWREKAAEPRDGPARDDGGRVWRRRQGVATASPPSFDRDKKWREKAAEPRNGKGRYRE